MTYGWMLLVVAIAGGTVFSLVQSQSVDNVSGFTGDDVDITDFGVSNSNTFDMMLNNKAGNSVNVKSIRLSQDNNEVFTQINKEIKTGDSMDVSSLGLIQSDETGTVNVEINYDIGGLTNQVSSGTISGNLEINTEAAAPNSNWVFVDVSKVPQNTLDTSEMEDFYIMKYEASAANNISEPSTSATPVSRSDHIPWTMINQNEAIQVCNDAGYNLPSNKEWQAATMALIGDSSTQPLGNNNDGSAIEDGSSGVLSGYRDTTLTGSGPSSWDNSIGIADLNGNVGEWTSTAVEPSHPMHYGGSEMGYINEWNNDGYPETFGPRNSSLGEDEYMSTVTGFAGVIRGGSWRRGTGSGVFWMSLDWQPLYRFPEIGFRCSLS